MKIEQLFEDLNRRFDYKRDVGIINNAENIIQWPIVQCKSKGKRKEKKTRNLSNDYTE